MFCHITILVMLAFTRDYEFKGTHKLVWFWTIYCTEKYAR